MKISPLQPGYGVRIDDYDLRDMTATEGYPEIRALFEQHSLLFFPAQQIGEDDHYRIATLFGPYEDRSIAGVEKQRRVPRVSNIKNDGTLLEENDLRMLDLKTNMLWHTDSIFLPLPALANMLVGRCLPPSGTSTEFASTRMAWAAMPEPLKSRICNRYLRHHYSHSRRKVNATLAMERKFTHWGEQVWKAIWENPVNGEEALYFASHTCGVVGMDDDEALALIDELMAFCTQDQFIYTHHWQHGDVLLWDERAMLHRAVPWNYAEARTLESVCLSVTDSDGFPGMRQQTAS